MEKCFRMFSSSQKVFKCRLSSYFSIISDYGLWNSESINNQFLNEVRDFMLSYPCKRLSYSPFDKVDDSNNCELSSTSFDGISLIEFIPPFLEWRKANYESEILWMRLNDSYDSLALVIPLYNVQNVFF